MKEEFDSADIDAVANALRDYERRCEEILTILGEKKTLSLGERSHVKQLYENLKDELKQAAKLGTVSGERRPKSRAEVCFFYPAITRAAVDLRPATNSNPISSGWFGAVYEAKMEFSYYLLQMNEALKEG